MIKIYLLIFFVSFNAIGSFSQTSNEELKISEEFYRNERYSDAIPLFLKLLKNDSLNPELNYKTGVCYLKSRSQKHKSVKYLKRSVLPHNLSLLPMNAYEYLGDSYQLNKHFDLAVEAYEKFKIVLLSKDHNFSEAMDRMKWKIEMCEISKKLFEDTAQYNYNASFSDDQSKLILIFHSNKIQQKDLYYNDFYIPGNAKAIHFQHDTIIEIVQNEATAGTSIDAQHILLYRNDEGSCNLYISSMNDNKWSTPHKLDKKINDKGWENDEYVSADNTTLYFTSDREGGFGGKDIYKCEKNSSGEWEKAINLGSAINTPFDEEAPFIHPNGKVLYFSSNRNAESKGSDIFSSYYLNDGTWTRPENVGYPLKTTKDEYIPDIADKQSSGVITFKDQKENKLTVLTGLAADQSEEVHGNITITVSDNNTGEISGRYHSKSNFSLILPPNRDNNITYESPGYLFYSENIDLTKNFTVFSNKKLRSFTPFDAGSVMELNNIFFEKDNAQLLQSSSPELKKLVEFLSSNNNLIAELSGYITSAENKKYNDRLSQERIRVVIEYLVSQGVDKNQIISKNYGKSNKISAKTKSPEKTGLSSAEQHIELKIIEIDTKNNSLTTQ